MNNNGFINRLLNFFKRLFFRNTQKLLTEGPIVPVQEQKNKLKQSNNFKEQIVIPKDINRERLLAIRQKWENDEIEEEDISEEDIDAIVAIYDEETEKIEQETEQIKEEIAKMLKELKETA